MLWGAHDPFASFSSRTPSSRNLSHRDPHEGLQPPLRGGEHQREKSSPAGGIRRGNSLPEGEIDAIAIVIERDIISIIIIIISTIYTAITTAAPRHRCSNSGISMNEVRKKLFTISLSGKAAHWYKLLKNGDSIDWEDIVPLFYSKFYPPSEIHKDRNRIYNFWPHDGESIAQAWGRLKSLMLKCPIHELPGNVIIDNFYARLSFQDKTLLDTSCSGSFTRNKEEFKRDLLDRIQENTEGWENDKDRESGALPPALDLDSFPCVEEAIRVADEFCDQYRALRREVEILQRRTSDFAECWNITQIPAQGRHRHTRESTGRRANCRSVKLPKPFSRTRPEPHRLLCRCRPMAAGIPPPPPPLVPLPGLFSPKMSIPAAKSSSTAP
ncbi:hypothetical protein QYE76_009098 [Lolium multiflorum]|uniref:Retrotransposon gag domain-containing protein n=1 Tax=Lolium multiflorum TaxID=4521 RepID=A0AAD8X0X6_LOLMU|nr:hypothetical protein QYE76_009098 [Lolium multiflorum]